MLLHTLYAEICSEKCIEMYVLCNSLAMCMDITETYDAMIGLRLLLYMYIICKAEKTHLGDRVEIRGL